MPVAVVAIGIAVEPLDVPVHEAVKPVQAAVQSIRKWRVV